MNLEFTIMVKERRLMNGCAASELYCNDGVISRWWIGYVVYYSEA